MKILFKKENHQKTQVSENDISKAISYCKKYVNDNYQFLNNKNNYDTDDLISEGLLGLTIALDKYDSSMGPSFLSYAKFRIRGTILDYLRLIDPLSRKKREQIKHLDEEFRKYSNSCLNRGKKVDKFDFYKEKFDLSLEEVLEIESEVFNVNISLDSNGAENMISSNFNKGFYNKIENKDLLNYLLENADLSEKYRKFIDLFYYKGFTGKEIAKELEISEGGVTYVKRQVNLKLKEVLDNLD